MFVRVCVYVQLTEVSCMLGSVPHHSIYILWLIRHGHESLVSFAHSEHCSCGVQVIRYHACLSLHPAHLCLLSISAASMETCILMSQSKQP